MNRERIPLIRGKEPNSGLTLFFATLCIVDIFGVFPIIALPRAIVQCGLLGIPLVVVVLVLQIYTAALLGKSWIIVSTLDPQLSRKNRYPLAAITELTMGPRVRTCVTILLDLTIFGGGIPNLLVASQNLQLFGYKISESHFDLSFCYWLLVVGALLCPLMWLGSPRDMKWLATCSSITVSLTAILIWWCIITDNREINTLPVPTSPTWDKFISGYGMLAFQFDVHPTLMTVQVDMRNPRDINKAVILSFIVSGSLFTITAVLAVWKYGGNTTANVLQVLPAGGVICAAILIAALQLCFSSSLGHSALFQHLEAQMHIERTFGWKRCALRSAVICLGIALGESVPRFDLVMALIGGSLTGPLMFVLPPLMYSRAQSLKTQFREQSSTPEILSGSERHIDNNTPRDPRIHSKSVYYGFTNSETRGQNRYSYVYYDHEFNSSELSDFEEVLPNTNELELIEQRPMLIDASTISRRRQRIVKNAPERAFMKIFTMQRIIDWFGYFVVTLGILITISSTYINVKNTIQFVHFTPPCIINATVPVSE